MKYNLLLILATSVLFFSCKSEKKIKNTLFELMDSTGINFTNTVADDSLENSFLFRNFYNGGGVAIGDINNDGFADVFLTSNAGANKLYLNKGNFKFEDISDKAGIFHDDKWNTGVTFADVNGDGWLDIYVCSSGHMGTGDRKNKLYINNHDLTFTESAANYGLDISAYTTQVSFFDYDMDGDLDCFMINNSPVPINQLNFASGRDLPDSVWKIGKFLKGGGDHLYRNDNGHFIEVTRDTGIHGGLISFGLGVSIGDINDDGYPDIFVSNDSYERDYLYINQKNGTFRDELEDWMQHTSFSSMGADIADINNDGYLDIFTTDMLPLSDYRLKTTGSFDHVDIFNSKVKAGFYFQYTKNCLQLNNKTGKFIDIARYAGVVATDWSWGALMFDMDNDGWNDLFVCNGVNRDVTNLDFMDFFANEVIQKMVLTGKKDEVDKVLKEIPHTPLPNKIYRNNHDLTFTDSGESWGMGQATFSNGAAYGDLDNDGDLDLIVNNENQSTYIYKNKSREINKNNYIGFTLEGEKKNPFAIGTKIKIFEGDKILTKEEVPSRGFQSSVDYKLIFGLGKVSAIDSIIVHWPDRTISKMDKPEINKVYHLKQAQTPREPWMDHNNYNDSVYFLPEKTSFEKHEENNFIDFYSERNIPKMLSREGPKAACADVNGDGLTDVYIGGTYNHVGQLYLQTNNGQFIKKEEKAFVPFLEFEDVACLFFDYDKDGDMDLLVCPGGNNYSVNSRELQLRLFKNDGKGNFTLDANAFTNVGVNVSVAVANDFNGDGYTDLFIGGRSYPGVYGKTPRSFVFMNDTKGHFIDIAGKTDSALDNAGMITGAACADITDDPGKELIVVGEWMPPKLFSFKKDHFEKVKSSLDSLYGWWQSVAIADVNNDGKQDIILGNTGENFYLRPDENNPAKLWINDFDQNGNTEKIITYTINGKDMPVYLKRDMEEQLPGIKKNNLKHKEYAIKSIQELFPKELMDRSEVKLFNYPSSCVALNEGTGKFAIQKLPVMCQMTSVNAIHVLDINKDGFPDLVLGGNQFGFSPQFERLDASFGDVLINDRKGGFIWQDSGRTGLKLRGQVTDIVAIDKKDAPCMLVLQNNEYPVLFKLNVESKTITK